jgi:hypothetical protein
VVLLGAGCRIKMHLKTKFDMGCVKAWFLGTKGQQATNSPTLFVKSFQDADNISKETFYVLTTPYKLKTAEAWEAFIVEAQEELAELEAWRSLRGIEEQSSGKDDGSDDSLASTKGNSILTSPPGHFIWSKESPDLPMPGWFEQKDQADSQAPKSTTTEEDIAELQATFDVLLEHVVETCQGGQADALEVLTFLGTSIAEVVDALDWVNHHARHVKELIGDVEAP